ncbi:MAG: DUF72 domain-containing protein [Bacteroidetes bacterium]|nr:DUF72 domain-containing protein [Bacteroidota bacterium]
MKTPKLYIGTAGWTYHDWSPSFYPQNQTSSFNWLTFYSQYFNVVEVNATFYKPFSEKAVYNWIKKVEACVDFMFVLKLHYSFTHSKRFSNCDVKAFSSMLDLLKREERLGGVLLQFPYSFECTDVNIKYLGALVNIFEGYDRFVEVRHSSWENKKARKITFCTIDQPDIGRSIQFNPLASNNMAYFRFHGRNEEAWRDSLKNFGKEMSYDEQNIRYNYLYSPGELLEFERKIREIYHQVKKIYVIMNNHPKGDAVANAFEMLSLLKDRGKIEIPQTTIQTYSRLVRIAV